MRFILLGLLCGTAALSLSGRAVAQEQTAEKAVVTVKEDAGETQVELRYLLFLGPAAKATDKADRFPLLLFLHGAGERGADLNLVKKHGPPKIVEKDRDFPFIVVSPQCPLNDRWKAAQLAPFVDELAKKYPIDTNRIYVTGLSMGGSGTWDLLTAYPHKFAAAAPICGKSDAETAEKLKHIPIWVFHGAKDKPESVENNQAMVAALQKLNGNVQFTLYPNAGHDSWTESYNNPALWAWMLKQRTNKKAE